MSLAAPAAERASRPSRPLVTPAASPSASRRPRRTSRAAAGLALAAAATGGLLGLAPTAQAACPRTGCPGGGWEEPADPKPVVLTVSAMTPGYGWSGDTVTVTGSGLTGAAVTVAGLPATVTSRTATTLRFVVPPLPVGPAGPASHPVVLSGPSGTATRSFTVSAAMQASGFRSFGLNAQFGQGSDGSARGTATLDRSSGLTSTSVTVSNGQAWLPLAVAASTVWLDGSGVVIGYTTPFTVSAPGFFPAGPFGKPEATGSSTQVVGPNPGAGAFARSAQVVLERDGEAELREALAWAVAAGRTIAQVVAALG